MSSNNFKFGILLQGLVNQSTIDIINEYKNNFPSAHILLSTWNTENTNDIPCEVVKSESPPLVCLPNRPKISIDNQIVGTLAGLKKIRGDIIMKCRTEQFIHNEKIFQIYENCCPKNKIMVPDLGTYEDLVRTSDYCQVATKELLLEYWNSIPLFDEYHRILKKKPGSLYMDGGSYFTQNYILRGKKDRRPWKIILREYFCVKSYHHDFQIEWEKLNNNLDYQETYYRNFPFRSKTD